MVALDEIVITDALGQRPARTPDHAAEALAYQTLAETLEARPEAMLATLVDVALSLCPCNAAGVSLLDETGNAPVFRWVAVAGAFTPLLNRTLPRDASPCGVVLDRNVPVLMAHPERYFAGGEGAGAGAEELLLVPFGQGGKTVGTVWLVSEDASRHFEGEDLRLLTGLTRFASAAVATLDRIRALNVARATTEALVAQLKLEDRHKDEFLATLAHELRNPLAPLMSGLEVLKRIDDPNIVRNAREMMGRQLNQMVRLVDDLLDVSRVNTGKIVLRNATVEVRAVIDAAVETSRAVIEKGRHTLIVQVDEGLKVEGDATRLAQVVSNLLHNAARYTPPGGHILVNASQVDDRAEIRVKDDGIGLVGDTLSTVFDLFTQVSPSSGRAAGGLGLGLSLVRKLVALHGGEVWAESAGKGAGSTFVVRLPLLASAPSDVPPPGERTSKPMGRLKIVVVDDNVDGAETLSMLLGLQGHDVRMAHDGAEALRVIEAHRPALVFLDLGLPDMDGVEVARFLRSDRRYDAMRLVALTGWGTDADRRRTREAGIDDHLTKPVSEAKLEAILRSV